MTRPFSSQAGLAALTGAHRGPFAPAIRHAADVEQRALVEGVPMTAARPWHVSPPGESDVFDVVDDNLNPIVSGVPWTTARDVVNAHNDALATATADTRAAAELTRLVDTIRHEVAPRDVPAVVNTLCAVVRHGVPVTGWEPATPPTVPRGR